MSLSLSKRVRALLGSFLPLKDPQFESVLQNVGLPPSKLREAMKNAERENGWDDLRKKLEPFGPVGSKAWMEELDRMTAEREAHERVGAPLTLDPKGGFIMPKGRLTFPPLGRPLLGVDPSSDIGDALAYAYLGGKVEFGKRKVKPAFEPTGPLSQWEGIENHIAHNEMRIATRRFGSWRETHNHDNGVWLRRIERERNLKDRDAIRSRRREDAER